MPSTPIALPCSACCPEHETNQYAGRGASGLRPLWRIGRLRRTLSPGAYGAGRQELEEDRGWVGFCDVSHDADMSRSVTADEQLASFIGKFSPEVAALAQSILAAMRERYPTALELVYDNYNALAIGFGPTEKPSQAIFSIAIFPKWVSLFFLQGKGLPDPDGILKGSGNVARHVRLSSAAALDEISVKKLMQEATARAAIPFALPPNRK